MLFFSLSSLVQAVDVFIRFHLANIGLAVMLMTSALVFNKVSVYVFEIEIVINELRRFSCSSYNSAADCLGGRNLSL